MSVVDKTVIAFLARAGSGKTTAANYFIEKHGATRVSFAGPLKELAKRLWGLSDEQVYGSRKEERSILVSDSADEYSDLVYDTPRELLQRLGNQAREIIGNKVWINAAMNAIANAPTDLVVIDDCRYINEAQAISELRNGYVVKIECPDRMSNADPNHPSEAQVDQVPDAYLSFQIDNMFAYGLSRFESDLAALAINCGVTPCAVL